MQLQLLFESSPYSSRLMYAAEVLLERVLGLAVRYVHQEGDLNAAWPVVVYGHHERLPSVTPTDFLVNRPTPYLPPALEDLDAVSESKASDNQWTVDPFAATFYATSLSHLYAHGHDELDQHGRYHFKAAYPYLQGLHRRPVVHEVGEAFWQWLSGHYPALRRTHRAFQPVVTLDIDHPWRYLHKPKFVQYGGLLRDVIQLKADARHRQRVLAGAPDPNDTHAELMARLKPLKRVAFFLFDGQTTYDNRFRSTQPAVQHLVSQYQRAGFELAIHPSYGSDMSAQLYGQQKAALEQIAGTTIEAARMHYVKYRLPETYRIALKLGIRHEYSTLAPHANGFLHGMCVPFPWYDFEAEAQTSLILHPTIAMDRTHQRYLQQSPTEAAAELTQLIETVKRYDGEFVWLLHNEIISDFAEWKGWRSYFDAGLRLLT